MSAVVALKDANFGAVSLDWIGRATSQMRVAAAFAAADWPNEFLVFDDEGTPFHSPAQAQHPRRECNLAKRAKLRRNFGTCGKLLRNAVKERLGSSAHVIVESSAAEAGAYAAWIRSSVKSCQSSGLT